MRTATLLSSSFGLYNNCICYTLSLFPLCQESEAMQIPYVYEGSRSAIHSKCLAPEQYICHHTTPQNARAPFTKRSLSTDTLPHVTAGSQWPPVRAMQSSPEPSISSLLLRVQHAASTSAPSCFLYLFVLPLLQTFLHPSYFTPWFRKPPAPRKICIIRFLL